MSAFVDRDKDKCSAGEEWILTWFSFSHFHLAVLLAGMARVAHGKASMEACLSYCVAGIIFVFAAEGIFAMEVLNKNLFNVQFVVLTSLLAAIMVLTLEQERTLPRFPLPRKPTVSSFDRRRRISVSTSALLTQLIASLLRTLELATGDGLLGFKKTQTR